MTEEDKEIYEEYNGDHYIEYRPVTTDYVHKDKIREMIKNLKDITRSDLGMFKQYEVIDLQIELLEELLK